jgi:hypothetical protein
VHGKGSSQGGRFERKAKKELLMGGAGWFLQTVVGGLLLASVLLWAVLRNRKSPVDPERTERATHDLYDEEEAARRRDDGEV